MHWNLSSPNTSNKSNESNESPNESNGSDDLNGVDGMDGVNGVDGVSQLEPTYYVRKRKELGLVDFLALPSASEGNRMQEAPQLQGGSAFVDKNDWVAKKIGTATRKLSYTFTREALQQQITSQCCSFASCTIE